MCSLNILGKSFFGFPISIFLLFLPHVLLSFNVYFGTIIYVKQMSYVSDELDIISNFLFLLLNELFLKVYKADKIHVHIASYIMITFFVLFIQS